MLRIGTFLLLFGDDCKGELRNGMVVSKGMEIPERILKTGEEKNLFLRLLGRIQSKKMM